MKGGALSWVTGAIAIASVTGCSRGAPRVDALRDALVEGDVTKAVAGAPACATTGPETSECLASIATWFGSKAGFHPPDQASAATAALAVARDGRGEEMTAPDGWLFVIQNGQGSGADALRLAVSTRMAQGAPGLGHAMDAEPDARALMKAVAASVPGACDTYALLGGNADDAKLPPPQRADHSPCVQKDLDRASGPAEHGRYGYGVWRGAEGALALWKDVIAALHGGVVKSDAKVQAALGPQLASIDAALGKIALKKLPPPADISQFASETHANPPIDAGAPQPAPMAGKRRASP